MSVAIPHRTPPATSVGKFLGRASRVADPADSPSQWDGGRPEAPYFFCHCPALEFAVLTCSGFPLRRAVVVEGKSTGVKAHHNSALVLAEDVPGVLERSRSWAAMADAPDWEAKRDARGLTNSEWHTLTRWSLWFLRAAEQADLGGA